MNGTDCHRWTLSSKRCREERIKTIPPSWTMSWRNYGRGLRVKSDPKLKQLPRRLALVLIRFYRFWISPMMGPHCRFEPTCSQYAVTAIESHGAVLGFWLTLKRLAKCHPFHPGGVDPVPPSPDRSANEPVDQREGVR